MSIPEDHPVEELETPDQSYGPEQVIDIQVQALGDNDEPHDDAGIETAYNFASSGNRRSTGPLGRFKKMVHNRRYGLMVDHDKAATTPIKKDGDSAVQEVTLSKNGEEATYGFAVAKQTDGEWEGCWMTESVRRID